MSDLPERPRLRWVEAKPVEHPSGERLFALGDPHELSDQTVVLPMAGLAVCELLLEGTRTIAEVAREFERRHQVPVPVEHVEKLVRALDGVGLIEGGAGIAAWRKQPVREAACVSLPGRPGCYPADPAELRRFLDEHYARPGGPGAPPAPRSGAPVRGVLSPHIDFERGGHGYAWAWKAVAESCEADTFIVFGTAHKGTGRARFALTRKNYATPLGTLETDQELVDRLLAAYEGPDLFDGELSHKREHSIEFQAVELAHLYGPGAAAPRKIKVVPILCGGIDDLYGEAPSRNPEIRAFHDALTKALADTKKERVCVVAGVDFAHVGAIFDDAPVTASQLATVLEQDRRSLAVLTAKVDGDAFHADIASDRNARRVCGHSAIVAAVERLARDGTKLAGELCHHDRWYDGQSSVSFASVVYRAR